MSRFIEMLETSDDSFSLENFQQWLARMVQRLEAEQGMVSASFLSSASRRRCRASAA